MNHFDKQNITHDNQHGSSARRSCESQLILTTDDLGNFLNAGIQVGTAMVILDFDKAFDKVSSKLDICGVRDNTKLWIVASLMRHSQKVVVDGALSSSANVMSTPYIFHVVYTRYQIFRWPLPNIAGPCSTLCIFQVFDTRLPYLGAHRFQFLGLRLVKVIEHLGCEAQCKTKQHECHKYQR